MKKYSLSLLFLLSLNTFATPQTIVAPKCLIKNVPLTTISVNNKFVLAEATDADIAKLRTQKVAKKCGGFMNVTDEWQSYRKQAFASPKVFLEDFTKHPKQMHLNYKIQYPSEVAQSLQQLNPQLMWDKLGKLTQFQDRYANSNLGVEAANWFKTEIETFAKQYQRDDVSVHFVKTPGFKQDSVVVKIGNQEGPAVVVGAHMDTLSSSFLGADMARVKPGADDDGSGSVVALEVARTILQSDLRFKNPIYFVWYAAEEEGLVGSKYVVREFKNKNINVAGVMHFDMTGFAYRNDPTMWVMDDYVNKDLTTYVISLIDTYVKKPVKHSRCGYACSDHANWTRANYPAMIPAEAAYENTNPAMHSSQDTMEKLSLEHMTDYAKLGTAFVVELAEPIK